MAVFLSKVGHGIKSLFRSFKESYVPSQAFCETDKTLRSSICDCSNQGKLLILHLTYNGVESQITFDPPHEDYIIFKAPYNSKNAYEISRSLPINSLPFLGVFFCPSSNVSDIRKLFEISSQNDLNRLYRLSRPLQNELLKRRRRYQNSQQSRDIIIDQDREYNEILAQVQREEAEVAQKKAEEEAEKEYEENVRLTALCRFNSLPPEPPQDSPETIKIRCMITGKPAKMRGFSKSDPAQLLFDFVWVDFAPMKPTIKFGFPPKELKEEDADKTFGELGFSRRETVQVDTEEIDE
ncbi:UBX domain containing protein [Histomonas meleagridis]|uniref:UBX domain containing protein n=1 Tax=Histomonas meleagridis TaxID=135588 RepID=UPI0035597D1F|nr:UBX domain containing protein [Histomonas meleagridis]KAH0801648.1 UBX domain containing protein [Histomonas meleagridis]